VANGGEENLAYLSIIRNYAPQWFDRSMGWDGESYTDAIAFCTKQDKIICPLEAICPLGVGSVPTAGYFQMQEAWVPNLDARNGWVQIGNYEKNSTSQGCMEYSSSYEHPPPWRLVGHATMCCKEVEGMYAPEYSPVSVAKTKSELEVMDRTHPVWFTRNHGYNGSSHAEATAFCNNNGMVLCSVGSYCPSALTNDTSETKLFLQKEPFDGEQWSPAQPEFGKKNVWVSSGKHNLTCATYEQTYQRPPEPEMQQNILCCQNTEHSASEQKFKKMLYPIWIEFASHGWKGGSQEDALEFCENFGIRKLCPYKAYCPNGPGHAVMSGHVTDFNTEGEQWAPMYSHGNTEWVMIGQKYHNSATTCMVNDELPMPDWGNATKDQANLKKHIMCCSY